MNDQQIVEALDMMKPLPLAEKTVLMKEFLENERFYTAVRLATDDSITFGVSNVKMVAESVGEDAIEHLIDLADDTKGNATKVQKDLLNKVASQNAPTFNLVQRIVRKTLDCGIGTKRLYEIAGDMLPYYPYMRCSGLEKLDHVLRDGEVFSQLKDNGLFLDIIVNIETWTVAYRTRNGNELKMTLPCEHNMLVGAACSGVFMGEATLLFEDMQRTMPRAEGNAIITQSIHEPMPSDIVARIQFHLWDFVPLEDYQKLVCMTPYDERLDMVDEFVSEAPLAIKAYFSLIETELVNDEAGVWHHFRSVKSRPVQVGEEELEGLVVKHQKAIWKDGTSSDQAKVKDVKECELVVTDWTPGDPGSKYEGMIGSLRLESSCGMVVVNSSGMKDALRAVDPDTLMGQIWTVRFTRVSTKKGSPIASLENPRLIEPRPDKTTADDRAYIEAVKSINLEER